MMVVDRRIATVEHGKAAKKGSEVGVEGSQIEVLWPNFHVKGRRALEISARKCRLLVGDAT